MSRQPTHPGALLREDVIPTLDITITAFAESINISRTMLYAILNEEKPITVDTALKLGTFLANSPEMWLNMQQKYDVWNKTEEMKDQLSHIKPIIRCA